MVRCDIFDPSFQMQLLYSDCIEYGQVVALCRLFGIAMFQKPTKKTDLWELFSVCQLFCQAISQANWGLKPLSYDCRQWSGFTC